MDGDLKELVASHVETEEVVEFCRELVRVPSENPPGDERAVAETAERLLRGLGLDAERVEPAPRRVSTLSSWGRGGRVLLFNGHYDVVPAGDEGAWPRPPYAAVVADGRIWGRGTTDMKAGIAACLAAVSALRRAGFEPDGRLLMHFVADEEALGALGTQHLVEVGRCRDVTEAIVGEPTNMHLVTAERGGVWLRLLTEGVSAHGATPHLGKNAIEHMAHVVLAVSGIRFRKLDPLLGSPTLNVGVIRGGSKINMVPDRCEIEIDRRTIPGETVEEVVGEIEAALEGVRQRVPELRVQTEVSNWAEPSETPSGASVVPLILEAREAFSVEGSEVGYAGATDARFLINQARVPAVVFGPGDPVCAHTVGEFVEVAQLVDAARIYAYVFARFLGA